MADGNAGDNQGKFNSLAGHFLISETDLMDPNFYHSVILITDHNEDGAFGLVINRPADIVLQDVVPEFADTAAGIIPVFVGGPVEQQYLFLLHDGLDGIELPEPHMHPVDGVVFQPLTETIAGLLPQIIKQDRKTVRRHIHLFAGYSGWSSGQLEAEILEGSWITHPASAEIIFHSDPAQGWQDAMSRKGDLYRIIAQTGFRPSMN
ncbi:YqgE/AlgH family protein [Spirochaeta dissipatitropha]